MKERDLTLDFMKGLAIFMVVLGHTLDLTSDMNPHPFREFIYSLHMPLFFFVSGYLVSRKLGSAREVAAFAGKKVKLMLPLAVFGVFNVVVCGMGADHFIHWGKFGLWFLWALFLFFMTYAASQLALLKNKRRWVEVTVLTLPALVGVALRTWKDTTVGDAMNFINAYNYCFFIMGVMLKRFDWERFTLRNDAALLLLLVYIVGLSTGISALNIPMKVAGVLFIFSIVRKPNCELTLTKWGGVSCRYWKIYPLHLRPALLSVKESGRLARRAARLYL